MRFLFLLFCVSCSIYSQEKILITGIVIQERNNLPIEGAVVTLEGTGLIVETDNNGHFELFAELDGSYILNVTAIDFVTQRLSIVFEGNDIDMGTLTLKQDVTLEQADNLVTLTDAQLSDDGETISNASGLLQATHDVFLNRAAFDFSQAFFRVRGYDSRNGQVLINGIAMNQFFDGRPQWNHWSYLLDLCKSVRSKEGLHRKSQVEHI